MSVQRRELWESRVSLTDPGALEEWELQLDLYRAAAVMKVTQGDWHGENGRKNLEPPSSLYEMQKSLSEALTCVACSMFSKCP